MRLFQRMYVKVMISQAQSSSDRLINDHVNMQMHAPGELISLSMKETHSLKQCSSPIGSRMSTCNCNIVNFYAEDTHIQVKNIRNAQPLVLRLIYSKFNVYS